MGPQETSWMSILVGIVGSALTLLLGYLVQRFNPEVKAKAEQTLWERTQAQLNEAKVRETKLENRITQLEEAQDKQRQDYEIQRKEYEKRISQLEDQVRDRDKKIEELIRAAKRSKKGKGAS